MSGLQRCPETLDLSHCWGQRDTFARSVKSSLCTKSSSRKGKLFVCLPLVQRENKEPIERECKVAGLCFVDRSR